MVWAISNEPLDEKKSLVSKNNRLSSFPIPSRFSIRRLRQVQLVRAAHLAAIPCAYLRSHQSFFVNFLVHINNQKRTRGEPPWKWHHRRKKCTPFVAHDTHAVCLTTAEKWFYIHSIPRKGNKNKWMKLFLLQELNTSTENEFTFWIVFSFFF